MNKIIKAVATMMLLSLFLIACDSVNTSVHGSYGVHYGHGYGYGYPRHYPTGRMGPPVTQPVPRGTQAHHSALQSEISRSIPN